MSQRNIYLAMENIKDLTASERQIVNFLLDEQSIGVNETIIELGAKTYTSASTVTRLYKKLGIKSFNEFRARLHSDFPKYTESRLAHLTKQKIEVNDDIQTIITKMTHNSVNALYNVMKLNSVPTFETVAAYMNNAKTIHFFGSGVSNLICRDAMQKALRSGLEATAHTYTQEMMMQARLAHPSDLAFMISYTGETADILKIAKILRGRKVTTISITSDTNNTIAKTCAINLFVDYRETFYRIGGMDSRMSIQHVLDILFSIYFNQNKLARDNIQKSLVRDDF